MWEKGAEGKARRLMWFAPFSFLHTTMNAFSQYIWISHQAPQLLPSITALKLCEAHKKQKFYHLNPYSHPSTFSNINFQAYNNLRQKISVNNRRFENVFPFIEVAVQINKQTHYPSSDVWDITVATTHSSIRSLAMFIILRATDFPQNQTLYTIKNSSLLFFKMNFS